jgi:nitrite reductase/ring-hydroxylating ferredoxin subunit/uncharacterized membrane protein
MGIDSAVKVVEQQEWLNPAEEGLQKLVHKAFEFPGSRPVKNFLHGTWIGHPLHVILTDIPIGAWSCAMVFDALDSISPRRHYSVAADTLVAVGIVGAVGAAATGLTDWQDIDPPARRVGLVHGLLNLASLGFFGGSLVARRNGARGAGRGLAALGFVVSALAAQLGGDLVYGRKIGVDHSTPEKLPDQFAPILAESELGEGKPHRAQHDGTPILLVRRGSHIYAIAETCSHLGGPLSEGKLDGDIIECPWHRSRFSIRDGHVVDGPAVHPQPCLEARVRGGQIEVRKSGCHLLPEEEAPRRKRRAKSQAGTAKAS